jgi:hypothetical protein
MRVVNYVIEEANIDWLSWCWKKKNQQDRAVSAPDSKFPIIAYHQNALPSGSRRRWPHLVGNLRVWNLLLECTRNRVGAANGKRRESDSQLLGWQRLASFDGWRRYCWSLDKKSIVGRRLRGPPMHLCLKLVPFFKHISICSFVDKAVRTRRRLLTDVSGIKKITLTKKVDTQL